MALDYRAPATCPTAAEFLGEIRSFIPALVVVSATVAAHRFEVSIDEGGSLGRLLTDQSDASRQIQGADCAEVARLLAFAVALVLDPNLQATDQPPAGAITAPDELGPAAAAPPHQPLPTPVAPPIASAVQHRVPSRPESRRSLGSQSLSAFGFAASATSPAPAYGIGGAYEVIAGIGRLEPRLRFGASYSTSPEAFSAGATVSFVNVLGLLEGCPGRLQAASLTLWPCLRVDVGGRSTTGRGIPGAKKRVRPWLSADALVHVHWRVAGPASVELAGGAMIPAWHDRVFLEPDVTIHQVPNVGWLAEIALGVEFSDRKRN